MEAQLASAASGIAAALRSGLSLPQSIRFAADESEGRLRTALEELAHRQGLGVPLEDSLERWARRSASADVSLLSSILRLRVGPGMPRVLDEVARTLRQRELARREVRSLTAQARLSGLVLAVLPVGFFLFLSATSREDMSLAYTSPVGAAAIVGGLVLDGLGFVWVRRLARVQP